MNTQQIWLVSGVDQGLAQTAVRYLLLRNQKVIAILANQTDSKEDLKRYQDGFPSADLRTADLFNAPDTENVVQQIVDQYGRIDRLINIGYSGLLSMQVLSVMQKIGKGHIIQLTTDENEEDPAAAVARVNIFYDDDAAPGVRYTFLSPDLCFQSMLTQKSN